MAEQEKKTFDGEGTIERMLLQKPFKFFDSHAHPGLEKKGIAERAGCFDFWRGNTVVARSMMGARSCLGDPNPTTIITKPEECPELTPETFIKYMDENNVEGMCLQCIRGISDPYPGNKEGWNYHVPNEYVKKEFIDAYPGRFTAVGGVHARFGKQAAVEMIISAHECGFPGIKFHPPTSGYPNNPDLYPAYEKMVELGMHLQVHTGQEELPGTRAKYQHPVYLDDVAMDFPDLKILQLHCGLFNNPMQGLWNVMKFDNLYTDITVPHPTLMRFKYYWDLDHMRFLEFFMPDKVFYGTDFPLTMPVYRAMIDNIMTMPLSTEFKHKLMGNNFRKFLNWETKDK
jgi:predicted TIM-barrel fold metal-dependent hydrolase